jgi:hypothetical protein
MRQRALAGPVIARLAEHPGRFFANRAAWTAHLDRLGISALTVNPDPVTVATEGALWGSIKAHGFLPDTVIVSDDARQFNVGQHGLCWVHAERLVHKLDTFTDEHRIAQRRIRSLIWRFYCDLKAYRQRPTCGGGRPAASQAQHMGSQVFARCDNAALIISIISRMFSLAPLVGLSRLTPPSAKSPRNRSRGRALRAALYRGAATRSARWLSNPRPPR